MSGIGKAVQSLVNLRSSVLWNAAEIDFRQNTKAVPRF